MMKRTILALAAFTTAGLAVAPAAFAGDTNGLRAAPQGVTSAALTAADQSATGDLGKAFTENVAKRTGQGISTGATKRVAAPVNVYMLSPQFVKDGSGPVGQFAYAATSYQINGAKATVYSAQTSSGWQGVNIATGDTEQALAAKASTDAVLLEPQVHAYYAVKGDTLQALNDPARKAIGGSSISLASYATQVHAKYASMLPGSSYDKGGSAGGFSQGPVATAKGSDSATIATSSVGAAAVLGAGAVVYRRRKKA